MPAEIITGKGLLHGVQNNGSAITVSGYASFTLDSARTGHKFRLKELVDENDYDAALVATNGNLELDLTWAPTAASRALAAGTAVFLAPLTKVTTANFKVAALNGDWTYIGDESVDLSASAIGKMTIKVRKYDDSTQNASLTTPVTG